MDQVVSMGQNVLAGKPPEAVSRYRCFVSNLAFTATEDELRELFEQYGTVVSVTIMADETGRDAYNYDTGAIL